MGASPYGWNTVCLQAVNGINTVQEGGCSTAFSLEGKYRQQVDIFENNLIQARDAAVNGGAFRFGGGVATPQQVADDMLAQPGEYCKSYPGACPADATALANQYVQILKDLVNSYGFDMQGNYSAAMDNNPHWSGDQLYAEDIVTTPLAVTPNVVSYSPNTGWRPAIDSLPPATSPTIPAFTSPSNVAATGPGSPTATSGGSTVAGTGSGSGGSQGGTNTGQTNLNPTQAAANILAGGNSKLLLILAAVAVVVYMLGRK